MLKLNVDFRNDKAFIRALSKAPQALFRNLRKAVHRGSEEVGREARSNVPKAHSALVNSIRSQQTGELSRIVGPAMTYGPMVENATEPGGFPALQEILDWMRVKRITPHNANDTERDVAFMIRRSIARKGTEKQPFMGPAAETKRDRVSQLMHQAVSNSLQEVGLA